jgi:hypothetical protein
MQRSPRTGLTLRSRRSQRRNRIPGSSPAAVPLACHSQQSRPVPSGQPRTTQSLFNLHRLLPSQVSNLADLALGAGGRLVQACIGLALPRQMVVPDGRVRARQADGPRSLLAAATGPGQGVRASVSARQRRLERRLPRRPWRTRWARRFPMAEPACLANLQQEGPQRLAEDLQEASREQPPQGSSPHAGTETDQGYRLQRWNRATKERPACARRSASVALFGHTPTTTC